MEKRKRATALGAFTRNENHLNAMLDDASPIHIVTPQFEKLQTCWDKLEQAHDNYIESIAGDIDEETEKSLDDPGKRYQDIVKRYSEYFKNSTVADRESAREKEQKDREAENTLKKEAEEIARKEEAKIRFDNEKAEIQMSISAFNRLAVSLKTVDEASDSDKRSQLTKLETEFNLIKGQLIKCAGIDHNNDMSDINKSFVDSVENPFVEFRDHIVGLLKNSSSTSGGTSSNSGTKKELIKLPTFQGDEKASPYVNFPIWKKLWETLIEDYEEKYRAGLLLAHLDDAARGKFIGYEGNYEEMYIRLGRYYGAREKVVKHVLQEVLAQSPIVEGDYKHLVSYSTSLENNFNRLSSMKLQSQMSNISTMTSIIRKFPRPVGEKWHEHILGKTVSEQEEPFPIFIGWISSEKSIWERMVSTTEGTKSTGKSSLFYVGDSVTNSDEKKCYECGEIGHVQRLCPNKNKGNGGGGNTRKTPKVKKFWCALHKGDKSKKCNTVSCTELRKLTDVQKRIDLLKTNGDCITLLR